MNQYLNFSEELLQARKHNMPIVALESTIISHGMPFPQNMETALAVEQKVRAEGAIPATIAVMDGKLCVGLEESQIERIARSGQDCIKCSRRDLPHVLMTGRIGTTTVAATMIIAELAGIEIFATGGIGGVHRGYEQTLDISADLQELANTNVAVVCAGAKSILDLPATLEYLETHGVPVLGFQTSEFPAFFSSTSGLKVDYHMEDEAAIVQLIQTKWALGLTGGVLITNPVPKEKEASFSEMEYIIEAGLIEMRQLGIKGKEITPFMLSYIEKKSKGKSLEANIALVFNNVSLAARLAKAYKKALQQ